MEQSDLSKLALAYCKNSRRPIEVEPADRSTRIDPPPAHSYCSFKDSLACYGFEGGMAG